MDAWAASTFWLTSSAAMNMDVSLQISALNSFGCIPRSGIAGLNDNFGFSFLRSHHTVFYGGCTMRHSHQQRTRVSVSPVLADTRHPLFSVF